MQIGSDAPFLISLCQQQVTASVVCIVVLRWTSLQTTKATVSNVDRTVIPIVSSLIKESRCVKFYLLSIFEKNALLLSSRA